MHGGGRPFYRLAAFRFRGFSTFRFAGPVRRAAGFVREAAVRLFAGFRAVVFRLAALVRRAAGFARVAAVLFLAVALRLTAGFRFAGVRRVVAFLIAAIVSSSL